MKDKALSGLDTDISSILESDEPDEIKVQKYAASLKRFKSYSAPRSIKHVVQPKKDAKYELLLNRFNQLKQKQQVKTPVGSADQRSEIDELFDDQDKTDDTSDYDLNELFEEKEQAKQPLDAWEKLTESIQKRSKLGKPQEKPRKKWHKWFASPRKSSRKPAARKTWTEY